MEENVCTYGEKLAGLDKIQLIPALVLFGLGVLSIFSAGAGLDGRGGTFAARQLLWGLLSVAAFLVTIKIGYEKFLHFWRTCASRRYALWSTGSGPTWYAKERCWT